MTAVFLLFFTGAILLAAEVMLPGGVAGVLGGAALLAGSVISFTEFGVAVGSVATLAALVLLGLMLYAELIWLPRTRVGREMVVDATIDSQSQPPIATSDVIGRTATALTTLAPSGFVSIEGRRYEAFCRTGLVARGAQLKVIGVDNFRLIVSESHTP